MKQRFKKLEIFKNHSRQRCRASRAAHFSMVPWVALPKSSWILPGAMRAKWEMGARTKTRRRWTEQAHQEVAAYITAGASRKPHWWYCAHGDAL